MKCGWCCVRLCSTSLRHISNPTGVRMWLGFGSRRVREVVFPAPTIFASPNSSITAGEDAASRPQAQRKIQDVQKATPAPVDQAIDMLRLTNRASELFLQQPAAEQRRLLQVIVGKAAWQDGALRATLFEPNQLPCSREHLS
jgi:hypothetical protein